MHEQKYQQYFTKPGAAYGKPGGDFDFWNHPKIIPFALNSILLNSAKSWFFTKQLKLCHHVVDHNAAWTLYNKSSTSYPFHHPRPHCPTITSLELFYNKFSANPPRHHPKLHHLNRGRTKIETQTIDRSQSTSPMMAKTHNSCQPSSSHITKAAKRILLLSVHSWRCRSLQAKLGHSAQRRFPEIFNSEPIRKSHFFGSRYSHRISTKSGFCIENLKFHHHVVDHNTA